MRKPLFPLIISLFLSAQTVAQKPVFTRQDSLRGSITAERAWWDLTYYHLALDVNIEEKEFAGQNSIHYTVLEPGKSMQIDLQPPLLITRVIQSEEELTFKREGNAYFIELKTEQQKGKSYEVTVFYSGTPQESENPPWSGGRWTYRPASPIWRQSGKNAPGGRNAWSCIAPFLRQRRRPSPEGAWA